MKKILSFILSIIILCNIFAVSAVAEAKDSTTSVSFNADGSTTYIYENGTTISVSKIEEVEIGNLQTRASTYNKAGSVSVVSTNNDTGAENWRYKLIGYFTYEEGVSSVCTNATYEYTISDTDWQFSNGSTQCIDNGAYGYGTMKEYFLFFVTQTANIEIRICCDTYGNFYS